MSLLLSLTANMNITFTHLCKTRKAKWNPLTRMHTYSKSGHTLFVTCGTILWDKATQFPQQPLISAHRRPPRSSVLLPVPPSHFKVDPGARTLPPKVNLRTLQKESYKTGAAKRSRRSLFTQSLSHGEWRCKDFTKAPSGGKVPAHERS